MHCLREYSSERQERVCAPLSSTIDRSTRPSGCCHQGPSPCLQPAFANADAQKDPQLTLGKVNEVEREPRNVRRDTATTLQLSPFSSRSPTPIASTSVTPTSPPEPMVTSIGEPLQSDYQIHELPSVAHLNYCGVTSPSEKARFC